MIDASSTSTSGRWVATRTVSDVGPAAVVGRRGGWISTSTGSSEWAGTVSVDGRSVAQPAAIPAGVNR